ncbi:hypothetical protein TSUD_183050 [Trifolium subterraneum]|uniref:Uncharacterized protein n=1 Tax=Trifolium subterraneum TaxID=3900 RepID=A0A2Z6NKS8_TRISU|nr:hypothetical protein TSUD_183050 [Trifolium subterraneum]
MLHIVVRLRWGCLSFESRLLWWCALGPSWTIPCWFLHCLLHRSLCCAWCACSHHSSSTPFPLSNTLRNSLTGWWIGSIIIHIHKSSPSSSIEVTGERRVAEEVTGDQRPPKHARVEGGGDTSFGPHKLVSGRAAAELVIPPAMGHEYLLDGKTRVKISDADQSILASMGPKSIRNVVVESSAGAHAKDFRERLSAVEKDLSSETKALEESRAKVAKLENDLEDAKGEEGKMKEKVGELEGQVASLSLAPPVDEEEKRLDPTDTYSKFSRADLILRIYQIGDLQLEVASSSFRNALAQLQVLNPDVQLVTDGMDELKEVRDGQIATPPLEEE